MINVNATLIVQIISFLVLVYILNRILLKPIMNIIEKRSSKIANDKEQLANLKEETESLIEKCISIEKDARKKALDQNSSLKREADKEADDLFNIAKNEIKGIREEADREIESKIEEANQSLKEFASQLSEDLTIKVIGRRFAG